MKVARHICGSYRKVNIAANFFRKPSIVVCYSWVLLDALDNA